jgi:hypothetical protein
MRRVLPPGGLCALRSKSASGSTGSRHAATGIVFAPTDQRVLVCTWRSLTDTSEPERPIYKRPQPVIPPQPNRIFLRQQRRALWNQSVAPPACAGLWRGVRGHFILKGERAPVIDDFFLQLRLHRHPLGPAVALFFQPRSIAGSRLRRRSLCFFEQSPPAPPPSKSPTREPPTAESAQRLDRRDFRKIPWLLVSATILLPSATERTRGFLP